MPTPNHKKSLHMVLHHKSETPSRHRVLQEQAEAMRKTQSWLPRSHNGNLHTLGKRDKAHQATPVQFGGIQTQARALELRPPRMQPPWEGESMDRA
jgi:hypothetical protein